MGDTTESREPAVHEANALGILREIEKATGGDLNAADGIAAAQVHASLAVAGEVRAFRELMGRSAT